MSQAEAPEKTLHLIDYQRNLVGIIRWHQQNGLSVQSVNEADQTVLDEWIAGVLKSPIGRISCEPEYDNLGEVKKWVCYINYSSLEDPAFLTALENNLYRFPLGDRILFGLPEDHPALKKYT